jgi:hypothetical protein
MENVLTGIDLTSTVLLKQVIVWMDGGSVTLELVDKYSTEFTVEFYQIMSLKKYPNVSIPGSFLLNGAEIPIRSDSERIILGALRQLHFSDELLASSQLSVYREIINKQISFVESDNYLTIAKEMGRL